jgi:hypothetical protein
MSSNIPQDNGNADLFILSGKTTNPTTANNGVWNGNPRTITSDSEGYIGITYRKLANSSLANLTTYYYQIEKGSTATAYEEYIEPKIYALNNNGVYEKFISKEDTLENYSTNEQRIGTWINGKTLYRKVVTGTLASNYTENENIFSFFRINDIDLTEMVSITGMVTTNSGISYSLSGKVFNAFYNPKIDNQRTVAVSFVGDSLIGCNVKIILEYTKTTD